MKKDLYLMRHGQTLFNVRRKIQGWCDSPLTELGIQQAQSAKELLKDTSLSIESISEEIGYANPKYFFKIFKKIVLCTPLEFRKQNKNSGDENAVQREKTEI